MIGGGLEDFDARKFKMRQENCGSDSGDEGSSAEVAGAVRLHSGLRLAGGNKAAVQVGRKLLRSREKENYGAGDWLIRGDRRPDINAAIGTAISISNQEPRGTSRNTNAPFDFGGFTALIP